MYSINANKVLSHSVSALLCAVLQCSSSIRCREHQVSLCCLPAAREAIRQTQTHKQKTLAPPFLSSTAATFPSANSPSTWLSLALRNHETSCETDQEDWRGNKRGRHRDPEKLDTAVHISAPHSSWHCFVSPWPVANAAQWSIRARLHWLTES